MVGSLDGSERNGTASGQARYVVHLPAFEGPLDLLLHLIERRQMEVTTISLVMVTDQYLAYLNQWEAETLPLANMAAFVAIAARLLFIKSQSLLPHTSREETNAEVESAITMAAELQRHLLEYKLAKEVATYLHQREEQGLQTHSRPSLLTSIETQLAWTPPILTGLDPASLAHTFQRLLNLQAAEAAKQGELLLPTARVRVSERIAEIVSFLQERDRVQLTEILSNEQSRFVIIVTFLAVLELWKWERINVSQDELMGPIVLERGEKWNEQLDEGQIEE